MAENQKILRKCFDCKSNIFTWLMIFLLITTGSILQITLHFNSIGDVKGETGSPPENGTTTVTWYIEANDVIKRTNEKITTKGIIVDNSGTLIWKNITARVKKTIKIAPEGKFLVNGCKMNLTGDLNCLGNGTFENFQASIFGDLNINSTGNLKIKNSTLILTGNLTVVGRSSLENCTIFVNCSKLGEFFISVEIGGDLSIRSGSNITAPSKDNRIRIFFISNDSRIRAEDSSFSFIGENSKFPGIKSESSDMAFLNCSIAHSLYGISIVGNDNANTNLENCRFVNNTIGLNLTSSGANLIQNCKFIDNAWGIFGRNTNQNRILATKFINNSKAGIYLHLGSNMNEIQDSYFRNNQLGGIIFEDACMNNTIINCTIYNTTGTGIYGNNNCIDLVIQNSTINQNSYNLKFTNHTTGTFIINSTLEDPIFDEIVLENSSILTSLNTTFDKNLVNVNLNSNLTVQWYLHVFVQNQTSSPIPGANVSVSDNDLGDFELNVKTDLSGWVRWLACTEYYRTDLKTVDLTPYMVIGEKFGYDTNITSTEIRNSTQMNLTLVQWLLFVPDLVPKKLSVSKQFPIRNDTVELTAQIKNSGYQDFNNSLNNVTVLFYADDNVINRSINLPSIPIQEKVDVTVGWKVNVTFGIQEIRVVVNSDLNLTEVNYTNNVLSIEIIINSIPTALMDVDPIQAKTFEAITFDASNSYNDVPEIGIKEYRFDFGDGVNSGWVSNPIMVHNYSDDGNYSASIRVRDISGQESAWSTGYKITVLNRPPVAKFSIQPTTGTVMTEFEFNPESSLDVDGTIARYYWTFSDGFTYGNKRPIHSFPNDVEYRISLVVWDDDNVRSKMINKTLKIINTPPLAKLKVTKTIANVSEVIIFNASASIDIDDEEYLLEYIWDFGDGTFGYNESIIKHNYTIPGIYNVTLYVKDDDGNAGFTNIEINITERVKKESEPKDNANIIWVIIFIVVIMVISFSIIMFVFITQSKKLRKKIVVSPGAKPDEFVDSGEFTTAGKLDFVILKKPFIKRFVKFELHKTAKSQSEFVGLIWISALLDKSWQISETVLDNKDKVIDYLQLKILAYGNKNWNIDYKGNGGILPNDFPWTKTKGPTVKIIDEEERPVEDVEQRIK